MEDGGESVREDRLDAFREARGSVFVDGVSGEGRGGGFLGGRGGGETRGGMGEMRAEGEGAPEW